MKVPNSLIAARAPALGVAILLLGALLPGPAIGQSSSGLSEPCRLDVDDNGQTDAGTDGMLIFRHLFGLTGDALVSGALGAGAVRTAAAISGFLDGCGEMLDADANRRVDALTDGVLILRHLTRLSGDALVSGALGPSAFRASPAEIGAALDFYQVPGPTFALRPPVMHAPLLSQIPVDLRPLVRDEGEAPDLKFELLEGPAGMEIDAELGILEWTPPLSAEGGSQRVRVRVSDGVQVAEVAFDLRVARPVEIGSVVEGNAVRVTAPGTLQGLTLDLPAEIRSGSGGADSQVLSPADLRIARIDPADIPGIPAGVIPLTDVFRVTPFTASSGLVTIRFPQVTLPAGRALPELKLYEYTADVTEVDGPLWASSQYNLDIAADGTVSIRRRALGSFAFIGLPTRPAEMPPVEATQPMTMAPRSATMSPCQAAYCMHCAQRVYMVLGVPIPWYGHQLCTRPDGKFRVLIKNFSSNRWSSGQVQIEDLAGWLADAANQFDGLKLKYDDFFEVEIEDLEYAYGSAYAAVPGFWSWSEPSVLHLDTAPNMKLSVMQGTAVHEFFHHAQFRTREAGVGLLAMDDYWQASWMLDGTARWFEDYLYDHLNTYRDKEPKLLPQILSVGLAARWESGFPKEHRPYARFGFWKLLHSCSGFSLPDVLNFDADTGFDPVLNLSEKMKAWNCSFPGDLGPKHWGTLAHALLAYQLATVKDGDINKIDDYPMISHDEPAFSFDTQVDILTPRLGKTESTNRVYYVRPSGAVSIRVDPVPNLPLGVKATLRVVPQGSGRVLVALSATNDIDPNNELLSGGAWFATADFDVGKIPEYVYHVSTDDSLREAPALFVTLVAPDGGGIAPGDDPGGQYRIEVTVENLPCHYGSAVSGNGNYTSYWKYCVIRRADGEIDYGEHVYFEPSGITRYVTHVPVEKIRSDGTFDIGSPDRKWDVEVNLNRREEYPIGSGWTVSVTDLEGGRDRDCRLVHRKTVTHRLPDGGGWSEDFFGVSMGGNTWDPMGQPVSNYRVIKSWPSFSCNDNIDNGDDWAKCMRRIKAAGHFDQCQREVLAMQKYPELRSFPGPDACQLLWDHEDADGVLQKCGIRY